MFSKKMAICLLSLSLASCGANKDDVTSVKENTVPSPGLMLAQPDRLVGTFFVGGNEVKMPYVKLGNQALIGDDVLMPLPKEALDGVNKADPDSLTLTGYLASNLWPGGIVPYVIEPGFAYSDLFSQVIQDWHQRTVVRFVPRTTEASYLIVSHVLSSGSALPTGVCGASEGLGRVKATAPQRIVMKTTTTNCSMARTISHELGHAVGLFHEHQRYDRDQYIKVYYENMQPGAASSFDKYFGIQILGPFDTFSLMHYSSFSGAKDGSSPSMTRKDGSHIALNDKLSDGDVAAINLYYGAKRCEINVSTCSNNIFEQGTSRALLDDADAGAKADPDRCVQRAKEFSDRCANAKGSRTTATYVNNGAKVKDGVWVAPHMGCEVVLTTCANGKVAPNPALVDAFEGSATDQNRCFARAKEFSVFCGNSASVSTTARYYAPSMPRQESFTFTPGVAGCFITTNHTCAANPAFANVTARSDAFDGSNGNSARCMARAHEVSDICVAPVGAQTTAKYVDAAGEKSATFVAPYRGCEATPLVCRRDPTAEGKQKRTTLSTPQGASAQSCGAYVTSIFETCGNAVGDLVTGVFYAAGGRTTPVSYGKGEPGCHIFIGACPAIAERNNFRMRDTLGGASTSKDVCLANARAYHAACRKAPGDPVSAVFVTDQGEAQQSNESWRAQ